MALFGSLATVRSQVAQAEIFRASFAYLEEFSRVESAAHRRLLALEAGKTERIDLEGGAFALEQVYQSKLREEGFFESHRAYIDVQAIIAGEEIMEVIDVSRLRLKEDRTPANDVLIYEMTKAASSLRMSSGDIALFFPVDGHMPAIAVSSPGIVRKVVIKVPVR